MGPELSLSCASPTVEQVVFGLFGVTFLDPKLDFLLQFDVDESQDFFHVLLIHGEKGLPSHLFSAEDLDVVLEALLHGELDHLFVRPLLRPFLHSLETHKVVLAGQDPHHGSSLELGMNVQTMILYIHLIQRLVEDQVAGSPAHHQVILCIKVSSHEGGLQHPERTQRLLVIEQQEADLLRTLPHHCDAETRSTHQPLDFSLKRQMIGIGEKIGPQAVASDLLSLGAIEHGVVSEPGEAIGLGQGEQFCLLSLDDGRSLGQAELGIEGFDQGVVFLGVDVAGDEA